MNRRVAVCSNSAGEGPDLTASELELDKLMCLRPPRISAVDVPSPRPWPGNGASMVTWAPRDRRAREWREPLASHVDADAVRTIAMPSEGQDGATSGARDVSAPAALGGSAFAAERFLVDEDHRTDSARISTTPTGHPARHSLRAANLISPSDGSTTTIIRTRLTYRPNQRRRNTLIASRHDVRPAGTRSPRPAYMLPTSVRLR